MKRLILHFLIDFTSEEGKSQDVYTVIRTFYSAAEKENLYIRLLSKVTCYQEALEQECNLIHRDFYTWEVIGILVNDMSLFDSHTKGRLSEISSRFNIL